jgi:8-oxo-dGTP diphosphatase
VSSPGVVDPRRPRENPGTVSDATPPSPFYRVSVKALVFDRDGRLLVVQEPDGLWEVPGGGWEHGESFEECLARELAEEVGAQLLGVDLATLHPCAGPGRAYQRLKLVVRAQIAVGELTPSQEIMALRWVTRGQFDDLAMRDGDDPVRAHIQSHWPD